MCISILSVCMYVYTVYTVYVVSTDSTREYQIRGLQVLVSCYVGTGN